MAVGDCRLNYLVEGSFADGRVVADSLDVEVGLEADLPECGQVLQPFADPDVAGVIEGGLGPKGHPPVALEEAHHPELVLQLG